MFRQRGTHTQRERKGESGITASGCEAGTQAGSPESAAEVGPEPTLIGKRHDSPDMHIFHDSTHRGEPVAAHVRGLPTIEKLVLRSCVGTSVDRKSQHIVIVQ